MSFYKKKVISPVVEIRQYTGDNFQELEQWCNSECPNTLSSRVRLQGQLVFIVHPSLHKGKTPVSKQKSINPGEFLVKDQSTLHSINWDQLTSYYEQVQST